MKATTPSESSSDPSVHSRHMQERLAALIQHARSDIDRVSEPRFQALLETTAEVLTALQTSFAHYDAKKERPWQPAGSERV